MDYEKGTAAWDISMVLTRHADGHTKSHRGDRAVCSRVLSLKQTAHTGFTPGQRLRAALDMPCTCGAGDSKSEETSLVLIEKRRDATGSEPAATPSG